MSDTTNTRQWSRSEREQILDVIRGLKPQVQVKGYPVAVMYEEDKFELGSDSLPGEPEDITLEWNDGPNFYSVSVWNNGDIEYDHYNEDGGESKPTRSFDSLEHLVAEFPSLLVD